MEGLEQRQLLATVSWDGGAGTSLWHDAANWDTDTLPGVDDDVVIDVPGSVTVLHNQNTTTLVRSILNAEALSISKGSLGATVIFQQNGPLIMTGGEINGDGNLYIRAGMNWSGGVMSGAGRTIVSPPIGQVQVTGTVTLSRILFNDGTFNWQSGNIRFVNGSLVNRPTGTFNAQSSGYASAISGTNGFGNNGILKRNGTSGTNSTFDVRFTNTGVVQVVQGGLRLRGGGASLSGSVAVNDFTSIVFALQDFVFQPGSLLGGMGTHYFNSGNHALNGAFNAMGSLRVQGAAVSLGGGDRSANTVFLTGGSLSINGALTPLTSMTWTGGTLEGPGRVRVPNGATLTISGGQEKYAQNTVLEIGSGGTAVWSGARLNLTDASIANSGTFRAVGDRMRAFSGTASIENSGLFLKQGGLNLVLSNLFGGVAFNNATNGELRIEGGTLTLLGGGVTTGTITGTASSSLVLGGVVYTIAAGTVSGVPSIQAAGPVVWNGGSIMGPGQFIVATNGSLILGSGAQKSLGRTLTNNGTVTWSNGTLQLDAATITNAQGATFNLGAANGLSTVGGESRIDNFGVFQKTGLGTISFEQSAVIFNNVGTLRINGTLRLDGTRVAQMSGGTLTGGTWVMQNGGKLTFLGSTILVNNGSITLSGTGASFSAMNLLTLNNGTISIVGTGVPLQSNGGQFTNAGTLSITQGGSLSIVGKVILQPTSTLVMSVNSPILFARIIATGSLELAGQVTGNFQFAPLSGDLFQFLSGSQRLGEFAGVTINGLPNGLIGQVQYLGQGARWRIL